MENTIQFSGNIVDIINEEVFPGTVFVHGDTIQKIVPDPSETHYDTYIMPGFIDSHIHIESSMLVPSEFAKAAVRHGTVATISDPHEIANVLGVQGVEFMIENAEKSGFKFYFGAPSCVPATDVETSGAKITAQDIETLFKKYDLKYLSEMMNFPGVLNEFPDVMEKISIAKKYEKVIDGHAPMLTEENLRTYIDAGISTDHETVLFEEGLEKIEKGMKVQIRQGSAAKDLDKLMPLIEKYPQACMLCSDDRHPDDLISGHINLLVKKAAASGIDRFKIFRAACLNPVEHYGLETGLLRENDSADFIIVDDLERLNVIQTVIHGKTVFKENKVFLPEVEFSPLNNFKAEPKSVEDFRFETIAEEIHVIEAADGQLLTGKCIEKPKIVNNNAVSDIDRDILKIAVVNRYENTSPSIGFIKNFGLKKGAMAGSVAHDSHNIISVGTSDEMIAKAVNLVIREKGGLAVVSEEIEEVLSLPVAGIMSDKPAEYVAEKYTRTDKAAKQIGSMLHSPFMTLSFMALPVIPSLKITDKGLFDVDQFKLIEQDFIQS
ncbi:adenine deaminase [Desulfonema magnum]|uniref:Adenine deaminase n=1 Tax=Desulfonema magnum TaxID=45655 RepID=A0A975BU78_9BACT|nr:adenine deaminase [Desulfonema magnum]QTA91592.1 Adenine deaminase [Desulfonema magnum]